MAAQDSLKRKAGGGGNAKKGKSSDSFTKKQKKDHEKTKIDNSTTELSSSAQKRQMKKDRQSHRRHADIVAEAKILWNKLRMKTNTQEETIELMRKVMDLIRGKVNEIALQHDASRVVQAAIQFGNKQQRKELLVEICNSEGSLPELAKIQYAHFCCLKFIKYCAKDDDCVKMIVKSFQGEMPKLAVHGVAARVVESLFLNLPPKSTASLKQEFFGPYFSLFVKELKGVPTLQSTLDSATTETQKKAAMEFVSAILTKGMGKSFYGYTFFQQLFAEYVDVADPNEIRTMASNIADHSIHLLSTRAGTRVVSACASYGTPKDRKRIAKSLKGYTSSSLLHRDAYLALLRLIQVTDDTVSIQKSILNEILTAPSVKVDSGNVSNAMLDLALSETGSKLFLMLLVEDAATRMKYFDPYERSILEAIPVIKDDGKSVPTSKKGAEIRRKELLKYIDEALQEMCIDHVDKLLFSVPGSRVLKEVYASLSSEKLANAVVDLCESSLNEGMGQKEGIEVDQSSSLFEDSIGHRAIKNLILHDAENDSPIFSKLLVERLDDRLADIAESNRGAFVAGALFKVPSLKSTLKETFQAHKKALTRKSKQKGAAAGYEALLKEISNQ